MALVLIAVLLGLVTRAAGGVTWIDAAAAAAAWRLRQPGLDEVMMALSGFGDGVPRWSVTALVSGYLLATRRYPWAIALLAAMGASALLAPALKLAFHTPRPSPLYAGLDAYSFPSGHATSAAALYIVLGVLAAEGLGRPWKGLVLGLAAALVAAIGLSRVYLGAHWLSDVLAGVALGAAPAIAGIALARGAEQGRRPADWRQGVAILACLCLVVAVTGPRVIAKAHRLYAPFLNHDPTAGVLATKPPCGIPSPRSPADGGRSAC